MTLPIKQHTEVIKEDMKSPFSALIHYRIGNIAPCPRCGKWTNYSKFAKHAREEHGGKTTKEILEVKENLDKMQAMYLKRKKDESQMV